MKIRLTSIVLLLLLLSSFSGCYRPPVPPPDLAVAPFDFDRDLPTPLGSELFHSNNRDENGYFSRERNFRTTRSLQELVAYYRTKFSVMGLKEFGYRETEANTGFHFSGWPGGKRISVNIQDLAVRYVHPGVYERSTKKKHDIRQFSITLYKNPR